MPLGVKMPAQKHPWMLITAAMQVLKQRSDSVPSVSAPVAHSTSRGIFKSDPVYFRCRTLSHRIRLSGIYNEYSESLRDRWAQLFKQWLQQLWVMCHEGQPAAWCASPLYGEAITFHTTIDEWFACPFLLWAGNGSTWVQRTEIWEHLVSFSWHFYIVADSPIHSFVPFMWPRCLKPCPPFLY